MTDNNTNDPENTRGTRPPHTPDDATPQEASLASRVQSSAAGLARAFQTPSNAAQTLSSATEGKAGPSRSGAGTTGETGYLSTGSSAPRTSKSGASEAFRESQIVRDLIAVPSYEEFQQFQDNPLDQQVDQIANPDRSRPSTNLQNETGPWKGKQRAHDPAQQEFSTAWDRAQHPPHPDTEASHEPNATDGMEVVTLLSDTTFDPNTDPYNPEFDLDQDAEATPLTFDEIKALESFRKTFSSQSENTQQRTGISGMSLIPDIDTFLAQDTSTGSISAQALRDSVLENLPGAGDWVGVQERYHDEVWGYLRPALEAAKSEMEEGVKGEGHVEGPAVRRLRMILKHMS
ncbi:uncharacterized protein N7477_005065 [Penicillium maclennaniae]|uniref:uncharacterized protein n=1 Tax=Penicillium maclennaniae TaxID=1343394 RepID=UPI002541BF13|nr:uncharacterized protein N7477_005065 [Penicillium maclennaniae]KAJ5675131.1 hypothetical protein N7477_005065 [Penicillium maclennaniae]